MGLFFGGTAIHVSDSLECTESSSLRMNVEICEDFWVDIALSCRNSSTLTVGSVYRHPQNNMEDFSEAFARSIFTFVNNKKYVILGDFNIGYSKYNSSYKIKHYADNMTSLGCGQLVAVPTRITSRCQSLLDHIYVNNSMLTDIQSSAVIEYDISDHLLIFLNLSVGVTKQAPNIISVKR